MHYKSFFVLLFVILTTGSCATKTFQENIVAEPDWFALKTIHPKNAYLTVGFGRGKTLDTAKKQAISSIVEQINLQISIEIKATNEVKQFDQDIYSQNSFNKNFHLKSTVNLVGLKPLKQQCENTICFVSFGFDNRPLRTKLSGLKCDAKLKTGFKSVLPINKITHCDWFLDYRQNNWYLDISGRSFLINQVDFVNYFYALNNHPSLKLSVKPNNRLQQGDYYHLAITLKSKGFLSLFLVNQLGQVQSLFVNRAVNKAGFTFPNLSLYDGFMADNSLPNKTKNSIAKDMLVGIFCPIKSVDLMDFTPVNEQKISQTSDTFAYEKLLKANANCAVVSQFIYIL